MAAKGTWKGVLDGVDLATANLIVKLHCEDVMGLTPAQQQRVIDARGVDGELAQLVTTHLQLGQSKDHLSARVLGQISEQKENANQHAFEAAAFGWHLDEHTDTIEKAPVKSVTCTGCEDNIQADDAIKASCGHVYCDSCLERQYRECMTDETLFPPRCCRIAFVWENVQDHVNSKIRKAFSIKRVELSTTNRIYCHVPTCSAFIDSARYVNGNAPCPKGCTSTCVKCKHAKHVGECNTDKEDQQLEELAERNGWTKCYKCGRRVELTVGCFHMTCLCKAQFCYLCAKPWKTSKCAQWDEPRLYERAEAYVNNAQEPAANAEEHAAQVLAAAHHLRIHHACGHEDFDTHRDFFNDLTCSLCRKHFPNWIYRCTQCRDFICRGCRLHRL